jgi:hypothetical protein
MKDRGVTSPMSVRQGLRSDHAFATRTDGRADHRVEQLRIPPQSIEAEQAVLGLLTDLTRTTVSPTHWSKRISIVAITN